jgi:glycine dehydrogenase subunit 2
VRAFYGNFGVLVRALAYIMAHGGDGLKRATLDALLNANYLRKLLEPHYKIGYEAPSMHECVFSNASTGPIAKRLIDYGFHPYTVSFPLIVPGAMMIEPTETESKQELDLFADALIAIARECEESPDVVLSAPHSTRTAKVDEVGAARKPILKWRG